MSNSKNKTVSLRPGKLFLFEMSVENDKRDKQSKRAHTIRAALYFKIRQLSVKLPGSQGYWVTDEDDKVARDSFIEVVNEAAFFNRAQKLAGHPVRLRMSSIDLKIGGENFETIAERLNVLTRRIFITTRDYLLAGDFAKSSAYLLEHGNVSKAFTEHRANDIDRKLSKLDEYTKRKKPLEDSDFEFLASEIGEEELPELEGAYSDADVVELVN